MGRKQRCCCGCEVATGLSATEICSGTWQQIGAAWETAVPGTVLFLPEVFPEKPWSARVKVTITAGSAARWLVSILGGASNCGDPLEFRWGWEAAGEFFELEGSRDPKVTADCHGPVNPASGTHEHILRLCWDGVYLTCVLDTNYGPTVVAYLARHDVSPSGGRAGFRVESLTNVTNVRFSDFVLERVAAEHHEECIECKIHCCLGPVPPALVVEFSGIPALEIPPHPAGCRAQCSRLNATVILAAKPAFIPLSLNSPYLAFVPSGLCRTDAACQWGGGILTPETCIIGFGDPPPTVDVSLIVSAHVGYGTGTGTFTSRAIIVRAYSYLDNQPGTSPHEVFLGIWYVETELRCDQWTEWMPLTLDPLYNFFSPKCNLAGSTARIKLAA